MIGNDRLLECYRQLASLQREIQRLNAKEREQWEEHRTLQAQQKVVHADMRQLLAEIDALEVEDRLNGSMGSPPYSMFNLEEDRR